MATVKKLKDCVSQFPDLEKVENNIYKEYLIKSIELMEYTHKNLIEKYPYLKKYEI